MPVGISSISTRSVALIVIVTSHNYLRENNGVFRYYYAADSGVFGICSSFLVTCRGFDSATRYARVAFDPEIILARFARVGRYFRWGNIQLRRPRFSVIRSVIREALEDASRCPDWEIRCVSLRLFVKGLGSIDL